MSLNTSSQFTMSLSQYILPEHLTGILFSDVEEMDLSKSNKT